MSSDAPPAKAKNTGAPAWVMTFADLMSLLMCFFVLLLSFSEMDVSKYKEMAGSLKNAFGVQRDIKVREPPKGINVIAREFSPGRPEPTHLNVIRQMTTNDLRINLDLGKERRRPVPTPKAEQDPDKEKTLKPQESAKNKADQQKAQKAGQRADDKAGARSGERAHLMPGKQRSQADGLTEAQKKELAQAKALAARRLEEQLKAEIKLAGMQAQRDDKAVSVDKKSLDELVKAKAAVERQKKLAHSAQLVSQALSNEIKAGAVDVETDGRKIIIRVREKASFGSGQARLKEDFRPILARVSKILRDAEGKIIVAGHTDNVPIYTQRFRSNWELSAARAVSVAHEMMLATNIPSERFLVQGFADTEPVANNASAANRAKNRRVEIILQQGDDKLSDTQISVNGTQPVTTRPADLPAAPVKRQTQATPDSVAPGITKPPVEPIVDQGDEAPANTTATKPKAAGAAGIKIGGSKPDPGKAAPDKAADKPPSSLGIKAGGH